jgi:plasmid stabilization system protein ParE
MILEKSEQFNSELDTIVQFIAKNNPNNALKFYDNLINEIKKIVDNPKIYRKR